MNTPSIEERVNEFREKFGERSNVKEEEIIPWLINNLSQARQEGRKEAVEYINHNLMWGRDSKGNLVMDSKHVTEVLEAALTTEGE